MTGFSSLDRLALLALIGRACVAAGRWVNRAGGIFVLIFGLATAPAALRPVFAQPAEALTVAAFGDSLAAGYGLPEAEGFTPRLQTWLQANGAPDVQVLNAGVSGDTTSGGLARLDWSIGPEADAVILELGANDMLRGVDPAVARANLDAMLTRLNARGLPVLLTGMRSLGNWGQDYVRTFEAIFPDLAEKHGVALYPFFLDGVAGDPALNQPDGIHPNARGVDILVERIGPAVLDLIRSVEAAQ